MSDGGQAFPTLVRGDVMTEDGWRQREWIDRGMSLRDYFAAQALKGAADSVCDQLSPDHQAGDADVAAHVKRHVRAAYLLADAMLAERTRPTANTRTDADVEDDRRAIAEERE